MIYLIAWSGGYEAPSYTLKATEKEAMQQAKEWAKDMPEGDTIDVLRIDPRTLTITRIEA